MPIDPRDDPKDNRYIDREKYPKTREYMIGHTKIITHHPETPSREAVIHLFDTINEIAKQHEARGIDTSSYFYTEEQLEELINDPNTIIL